MSVLQSSDLADCVKAGWDNERILERKQHNPASKTGLRDELVARIVTLKGGGANTSNVLAALQGDATPAAALATIQAIV